MNLNKALDKEYETKSLKEIADAPVAALEGVSEKDAGAPQGGVQRQDDPRPREPQVRQVGAGDRHPRRHGSLYLRALAPEGLAPFAPQLRQKRRTAGFLLGLSVRDDQRRERRRAHFDGGLLAQKAEPKPGLLAERGDDEELGAVDIGPLAEARGGHLDPVAVAAARAVEVELDGRRAP